MRKIVYIAGVTVVSVGLASLINASKYMYVPNAVSDSAIHESKRKRTGKKQRQKPDPRRDRIWKNARKKAMNNPIQGRNY